MELAKKIHLSEAQGRSSANLLPKGGSSARILGGIALLPRRMIGYAPGNGHPGISGMRQPVLERSIGEHNPEDFNFPVLTIRKS